jgi:hypothetical protein
MKRTFCAAVVAVLAVAFLMTPVLRAERNDDFQAIQKAVKQNPAYEAGKEVKWFKVLVTDTKTGVDKVKITVPLALVELFLQCDEAKHVRLNGSGDTVDIQALFSELKKIGPMALIEVYDKDEAIKVWLE